MWEALANAFKVFAEKHLIPTVISVAAAIGIVLALPDNYWMVEKIGQAWVGILSFCIVFIAIQLVLLILKGIKKAERESNNRSFLEGHREEEEKKVLNEVRRRVDGMSPDERDLLNRFLDSDNSPYIENANVFRSSGHLLNSNWVVSSAVKAESETIVNTGKGIPVSHIIGQEKKQYKLQDEVYKALKYLRDKYGRISNFE